MSPLPYFSLLLVFAFLIIQEAQSQVKLQGSIKDKNANLTSGIAVLLKPKDKKNVVAYAYSNDDGHYELTITAPGEYILSLQGMGFESKDIPVDIRNLAEKVIQQDITLASKVFELTEVEINAEVPILIKEDTISINTKVFVDGTEQVVEDILRKLPGIEVSSEGSISVQGKQVQKVLVEGDDLFEKGYKLLTKNLNAGVIDKVEILEHFSDNPLLKNIQDSEHVALNLTLKEDHRSSLFGNTSLASGIERFYEVKANLISFQNKSKYYLFANANNRGIDATGDIYQLIYPDIFTDATYLGDGESAERYLGIAMPTPNLKPSQYKFNEAELVSFNSIFNPSKKIKIKAMGYFTSDENSFLSESVQQFNVPPVTFTNTESYELRKNTRVSYAKVDAMIKLSKDDRLDYIGRFNQGDFRDRASLIFNTTAIREDSEVKTEFTDQRITYTRRFADKDALQLTARYIYDEKPERYRVNTFLYQDLFPEQTTIEEVVQSNLNKLYFTGLEATYIMNKSRNYLELHAGLSSRNQLLDSDLFLQDNNGDFQVVGGDFANELKVKLDDLYAKVNYKFSFPKFQLKTDLALHQYNNITEKTGVKTKITHLVLVPRIGFVWLPNKKINVIASYKYDSSPMTTRDQRHGYILTNYRYFSRGFSNFQLLSGSYWFTGLNYGSWADAFSLNASFFLNSNKEYLSTNGLVGPNYNLSEQILLDGRRFAGVSVNMSQYLEQLSSSIRVKLGYSKNQYENIINNSDLRSLKLQSITYGGEFKSVLTSSLDFNIGKEWERSIVDSGRVSDNLDSSAFMDLIWQPSANLNISLKNERYYFGSLSSDNTFYFSDLEMRYQAIPNKLTLHFLASNIWDTDTFRNYTINETGFASSNFRLLPRYFFLKADYRF